MVSLPKRCKHIRADERDPPVAAVETLCIQLRILADYEPLRDMAAAIDDNVAEPRATADLDIGQQHRAGGPSMRIDSAAGKQ